MITKLLKELQETWGYTPEELNDIREKFEELASSCYWDGYNERSKEDNDVNYNAFVSYGKKEDFE